MPEFNQDKPFEGLDFQWIAREQLFVDASYQRLHIRHKHVGDIVRNWDPDHFGALNVSPRKEGLYAVVDGQHRLIALDNMHIRPTTLVPCVVHATANEPITFVNLNTRANVDPMEQFRAEIEGGDASAIALNDAVVAAGFEVATHGLASNAQRRERSLYCIAKLKHIAERSGSAAGITELLEWMLGVWPQDKDAYTSPIIGGCYEFKEIYAGLYENDHLVKGLQQVGPRNLVREAREFNPTGGSGISGRGGLDLSVARAIRSAYIAPGYRLPDIERVLRDRRREARRQAEAERAAQAPVYRLGQEQA